MQCMHENYRYALDMQACSETTANIVENARKLLLNLLVDDFTLNLSIVSVVLYMSIYMSLGLNKPDSNYKERARLHWSIRKDVATTWCICSTSVLQQCQDLATAGLSVDDTYERLRALLLPYQGAWEINDRNPIRISSPVPSEVLEAAASSSSVTELDVSVHRPGIKVSAHTSSLWLPLQLTTIVGSEAADGQQLLEISSSLIQRLFPSLDAEISSGILTDALNTAFNHSAWGCFANKMSELRKTNIVSDNLQILIEVLTSALLEICSDTSTSKTSKLMSNISSIIMRVPGVFEVRAEIRDRENEGEDGRGEILYKSQKEVEIHDEDCLLYSLDCFEITGNLAIYSEKHSRKISHSSRSTLETLSVTSEARTFEAIAGSVARRLYELRKGHRNKLSASLAMDELKSKKSKYHEAKERLEKVESSRSVMANEIEVLRSECTDLRNLLKQEQAISTEAARRLQFARESSEKSLDDISREFKSKEAATNAIMRDTKAEIKKLSEELQSAKDKCTMLQKDKEALGARVIEADKHSQALTEDMTELTRSFEKEKSQSEETIRELQNTIEQKLNDVINRNMATNMDNSPEKLKKSLERAETDLFISKESQNRLNKQLKEREEENKLLRTELDDTQGQLDRAEALLRAAMAKIALLEEQAEDDRRRGDLFQRIADEQIHLNKASLHHPLESMVKKSNVKKAPFVVRHLTNKKGVTSPQSSPVEKGRKGVANRSKLSPSTPTSKLDARIIAEYLDFNGVTD